MNKSHSEKERQQVVTKVKNYICYKEKGKMAMQLVKLKWLWIVMVSFIISSCQPTQQVEPNWRPTYCVYIANASSEELNIQIGDTICLLCNADFLAATGGVCPGTEQKPEPIEIMDQRGNRVISLILQSHGCTICPREGKKFNFAGDY